MPLTKYRDPGDGQWKVVDFLPLKGGTMTGDVAFPTGQVRRLPLNNGFFEVYSPTEMWISGRVVVLNASTDVGVVAHRAFLLSDGYLGAELVSLNRSAHRFGNKRLTNVADPTGDQDAATRKWVIAQDAAAIAAHVLEKNPHSMYLRRIDTDDLYLPKTGGRLSGQLTVGYASAELVIDSEGASTVSGVRLRKNGAQRWFIGEDGGTGRLAFSRYSLSTGSYLDTPLSLDASGFVVLNKTTPTSANHAASKQYVDTGPQTYSKELDNDYVVPTPGQGWHMPPGMTQTISGPCAILATANASIVAPDDNGGSNVYMRLRWSGSFSGNRASRDRAGGFNSGANAGGSTSVSAALTLAAGQSLTFVMEIYVSSGSSDWRVVNGAHMDFLTFRTA